MMYGLLLCGKCAEGVCRGQGLSEPCMEGRCFQAFEPGLVLLKSAMYYCDMCLAEKNQFGVSSVSRHAAEWAVPVAIVLMDHATQDLNCYWWQPEYLLFSHTIN